MARNRKKSAFDWAKFVPLAPDELSKEAREMWPDLREWPTPKDIKSLVRKTKRDPSLRLELLSGLRQFSETEVQQLWSFTAVWFAVLIGLLAVPAPDIVRVVLFVGVVVLAWIVLEYLTNRALGLSTRGARARVWLMALEDAVRR